MTNPPNDDAATPRRKRRPRRATVAGTGPAAADGPEPKLHDVTPAKQKKTGQQVSERDRWMLAEKPPHY